MQLPAPARGCQSQRKPTRIPNVIFHELPADAKLRQEWVTNLQTPTLILGNRCHVCSKHYDQTSDAKRVFKKFIIFGNMRRKCTRKHNDSSQRLSFCRRAIASQSDHSIVISLNIILEYICSN